MIQIHPRRPGAIAPMAALLMVFIVAMASFAVDFSWVSLTQSELQNGADAAALAGANALLDNYVDYHLANQTAGRKRELLEEAMVQARYEAKVTASLNGAGDKSGLLLRDQDIEFGVTDGTTYKALDLYNGYPNAVKVKLRRDTLANGPLGLYFGRVIGASQLDLAASAAAAVYGGVIDSFKSNGRYNVPVLPVAFDVNHWNDFIGTGKDPDGKISLAADGDPQLLVYPSTKYKGNFGLLSLNGGAHNASQIDSWIHKGMAPIDIDTLHHKELLPLSARLADLWNWEGAPGIKASNVMDISSHVGKSFLLPLYKPVVPTENGYLAGIGAGQNLSYNIVAFVGVRVVEPDTANQEVVVQPAAVVVPDAVFKTGSLAPAAPAESSGAALLTTFAAPKLFQ